MSTRAIHRPGVSRLAALLAGLGLLFAGGRIGAAEAVATDSDAEPTSRAYLEPADRLLVETGPERRAWRGWPVRVQFLPVEASAAAPGTTLLVRDGAGTTLAEAAAVRPGVWWLGADVTRRLPAGDVTLQAGTLRVTVNCSDPPATLSDAQRAQRWLAVIGFALDAGDLAGAKREADAWVASAPGDVRALVAQGDVLAALKDHTGAYQAFQAALRKVAAGHPNLVIERKANAQLAWMLGQLPVVDPAAPAPDTLPEVPPAAPVAPGAGAPPTDRGTQPAPAPPGRVLQWASTARASSEYRTTDYGAARATGAPDVPRAGDHRNAWTPRTADAGAETLELDFTPPVRAGGLRVVQSDNPGALMRIEVLSAAGEATTVWSGPDATVYGRNAIGVLEIAFPPPVFPVARVRLTLDTRRVPGFNAIDAVGLFPLP